MKKRFVALVVDAESFIGNNSYDEFERVTEDGDFPAIEDYCRVVGRYDTEDEAFESLNHIDGDVLVYDTVKQELFN